MKLNKLMIALVVMLSSFTASAQDAKAELPVVATVGAAEFTDIHEAFAAAINKTVVLREDVELTKSIDVIGTYAVTVLGQGNTIRFVGVGNGFVVSYGAVLTLDEDLTIVGDGANVCPVYIEDATVISSATIETTSGNACAPIMTHYRYSANLTVEDGSIISGNSEVVAIDWKSPGTLAVNAGTIKGASAIYLQCGALNINGGKFTGKNSAVKIENSSNTIGVNAVAITNGTFTSTTGVDAVQSTSVAGVAAKDNFITGGAFSSNVESLVAVGYKTEENGDGTYSVVRDESVTYVAQVGANFYTSLVGAVEDLNNEDELILLQDVTLTSPIIVEKAGVINLKDHTITANCKDAFRVFANTTIKNGTIISESRCINTRIKVTLTLEDLELKATSMEHSNPQPITIGGTNTGTTTVTMNRVNVDFAENCLGYAIISFVKANLTATGCNFTNAYSALYANENNAAGSVFTFNNCNMQAQSPAPAPTNQFGLIALYANNVTVNLNDCNLAAEGMVSALCFHSWQGSDATSVFAEGCKVNASAGTVISGDLIVESNKNFSKNTVVLPATEAYIAKLKDENFWVKENGDGTVTPLKSVSFEDNDFAYTNDTDLENMDVTYTRTFSNSGVWNAVFFPFEVALSEEFLQKYEVAEWTDVVTEVNGNVLEAWSIELTKIKDPAAVLQANRPYFILAKTDADKAFKLDLKDVTLTAVQPDNKVEKVIDGVMTCTMVGNYKKLSGDAELGPNRWVVSASGKWIHAGSMKAFRVFMTRELAPGITAAGTVLNSMRVIIREPNGGTTVIEGIEAEGAQVEATYDLQGRSVVNPTKGSIYIVNGKKVIKK
ncbi:MAG: hypothetical protein J6S02_05895 [Bacteroidaceae bacterium]|nr:hypothetical protein [Bacteroidaceae bacterium]